MAQQVIVQCVEGSGDEGAKCNDRWNGLGVRVSVLWGLQGEKQLTIATLFWTDASSAFFLKVASSVSFRMDRLKLSAVPSF